MTELEKRQQSAATLSMQPKPTGREIDRIVDGWNEMIERTAIAEARAAEAIEQKRITDQLNIKLVAEVEMLHDTNDRLTASLSYTQNYATDLTTRLTVVGDIVKEAVNEARQFARNKAAEPKGDQVTTADAIELKRVVESVSRIPQNKMNTEPGGVTPITRR